MSSLAVIELSGVGAVLTARLNEFGLFTTHDLLRANRRRLDEVLEGASVAQIRIWQAVSELLEIHGMVLPLAEGLYARGIETLDELGGSSLSKLRAVVGAMQTAGIAGADASDEELVVWMKDALLLRNTGTLNGTVSAPGKLPLEGVGVRCLGKGAESDARGRFRIRRLPLGRPVVVHLEHPDYRALTVETSRIAAPGILLGEHFQLSSKRSASPRVGVPSELRGDRIPSTSSAPVTIREQDRPPPENDLLRVFEVPESGDARAVSLLFDYDAGVLVVRSFRLKRGHLAARAKVGDHLVFSAKRWRVTQMTPAGVKAFRRRLRLNRLRPPMPPDPTAADVERAIRDFMRAVATERGKVPH